MLCHPQSGNNWFRACAQGDISLVEKLKTRKKGSYDSRPSSGNGSVFKGFTGLHYAVYFDRLDVVKCLIDLEYDKLTQCSVLIYPYLNPTPIEISTTGSSHSKTATSTSHQQNNNRRKKNLQAWSQQSATSHTEVFDTSTNTLTLHTCTTPSIYSMHRVYSDAFDHTSASPMLKTISSNNITNSIHNSAQPFTLDKGSSALMIAIARRNFKVAKYIIDWLKNWKLPDGKKSNPMLKLQNTGSMSALMILCTMRASAAAAAILQSGDMMLLHHEFVLLSKEGKSCLHYCIDSGSYMILETIFWVMCDRRADSEEGYVLLYRLAQMLLYDRSLPKQTPNSGRQSRISQGNAFSARDDTSSTSSIIEEQPPLDGHVLDLSNIYNNMHHVSTGESISNHQRTPTIVQNIKQQTLLDYVLYQTSALAPEVRSSIYSLVYYYSKKVYLWAEHDYISTCKKYSNMTPDISFLKHVKRWSDFESRYPKPQRPYSPANKGDAIDFSSPMLSARQSTNALSVHLSPVLVTDSTIRSSHEPSQHRRCISLTNITVDSQSHSNDNNGNDSRASIDTLQLKNKIVRIDTVYSPLVKSLASSCTQYNGVTFHVPSENNIDDYRSDLQMSGLKKRKNSVQHLLREDSSTKEEKEENIDNCINGQGTSFSNTFIESANDGVLTNMSTAIHVAIAQNEQSDDAVPRASPVTNRVLEESSDKDMMALPQISNVKSGDSPTMESLSARNPGSVQHNVFRHLREPPDLTPTDIENSSLMSNSRTCSRSTSASDFNASCRSIIRVNNSPSFEKVSDSEGNSVINIPQISSSE